MTGIFLVGDSSTPTAAHSTCACGAATDQVSGPTAPLAREFDRGGKGWERVQEPITGCGPGRRRNGSRCLSPTRPARCTGKRRRCRTRPDPPAPDEEGLLRQDGPGCGAGWSAARRPSRRSARGWTSFPGDLRCAGCQALVTPVAAVPDAATPSRSAAARGSRRLRLARQDGQDPHDVVAELGHVVLQEVPGRLVGDLTAPGEDLGGEGDVGLGCGHLPGVAEAQHRPQALLTDGGADRADGGADDAGGDVVEGVLAPRSRGPVDGVLQRAGDRPVVLGGDEQDGVGPADRILEGGGLGRVVRVVVLAVEGQVPDRDLGELEVLGGEVDQDLGELAVDGGGGEASDEVADLVLGHVLPFIEGCVVERRRDGGARVVGEVDLAAAHVGRPDPIGVGGRAHHGAGGRRARCRPECSPARRRSGCSDARCLDVSAAPRLAPAEHRHRGAPVRRASPRRRPRTWAVRPGRG